MYIHKHTYVNSYGFFWCTKFFIHSLLVFLLISSTMVPIFKVNVLPQTSYMCSCIYIYIHGMVLQSTYMYIHTNTSSRWMCFRRPHTCVVVCVCVYIYIYIYIHGMVLQSTFMYIHANTSSR